MAGESKVNENGVGDHSYDEEDSLGDHQQGRENAESGCFKEIVSAAVERAWEDIEVKSILQMIQNNRKSVQDRKEHCLSQEGG